MNIITDANDIIVYTFNNISKMSETSAIIDGIQMVENIQLYNIYNEVELPNLPISVINTFKYIDGKFIFNEYNNSNNGIFEWNQTELRKRFKREELVKIDNHEKYISSLESFSDAEKSYLKDVCKSIMFDFNNTEVFCNNDNALEEALNFFVYIGFIKQERVKEILIKNPTT